MILYIMVAAGFVLGGYYINEAAGKKHEHLQNWVAGVLWPVTLGLMSHVLLNREVKEVTDILAKDNKDAD